MMVIIIYFTSNILDVCDREKRIVNFYMPYYNIFREAIDFIQPRYGLMIHSFTKDYEDRPERNFQVGILYREKGELADRVTLSINYLDRVEL